ncbi:MAG TPA: YggS family pyridoxal phosphate-dependent enzyme [Pyrinomonadaceae bacterium]|nr:YggS family pyridoxal phosphate-dependent enzyme [Pyrinomonadaceae bacterium]
MTEAAGSFEGLRARLAGVRSRVRSSAERAGRDPSEVTLIAVSKTHPAPLVARALSAGAADLGENRVQEAEAKAGEVARLAGARPRWHLIGPLQSNKARRAVRLFDVIHTVDSAELVARVERLCEEEGRDELPVLAQLSLADEPTKSGATEDELPRLVEKLKGCARVRLAGLMTMPPFYEDAERARPYFRRLRELRDGLREAGAFRAGAGELSMGMSHDFEVAIEEGATMVRVGTAIFGERAAAR